MAKLTTNKAIERAGELEEFAREQLAKAVDESNWEYAGRLEDCMKFAAAIATFLQFDVEPKAPVDETAELTE